MHINSLVCTLIAIKTTKTKKRTKFIDTLFEENIKNYNN